MCSLANNFIDFGFTVLDVCKYRNAGRDPEDWFEFDGYERLDADMKREFGDIGWWLDTSAMTADQTAERLVEEVASRTTSGGHQS
jgi:hypothetical protein